MASLRVASLALLVIVSLTSASPTANAEPEFWKGTVEEMRSMCSNDDPIACLKYKFMSMLDMIFKKDAYQITDNVEISRNAYQSNDVTKRGDKSLEENVEEYIQTHDATLKIPLVDSTVTIGTQNLDQDELNLKVRFSGNQPEARKSKLKKIIVPIFIFILLKAITLIPLALGVLGLKAWNALQLSFFSFVVSIALAVFQLCKKLAADSAHPHIAAHGPWDAAYAARSFQEQQQSANIDAQNMAYAAYL